MTGPGDSGPRDEGDLLAMPAPELQRALLKVPDDLLAQALAGTSPAVATRLGENLSARRASAVRKLSSALRSSGELTPGAARTALGNLVRKIFELGAREDGAPAGRGRAVASAEAASTPPPAEAAAPDLTPQSAAHLREARAALDAARRVSSYVKEIENGKRAANAAVLMKTWLRWT